MLRLIFSACFVLIAAVSLQYAGPAEHDGEHLKATNIDGIGPDEPLPLLVPYLALMTGIVDWSAYGIEEIAAMDQPLSENDWDAAGMAAINIVATSTLLSMEGTGANDAQRFADPDWKAFVADLQNAALLVAISTQTRDRPALGRFASLMSDACHACHERYKVLPPKDTTNFAQLQGPMQPDELTAAPQTRDMMRPR